MEATLKIDFELIGELCVLKQTIDRIRSDICLIDSDDENTRDSFALFDCVLQLRKSVKMLSDAVEDEYMFFFLRRHPNGIYRESGEGLKLKKKKIYSVRDDQRTVESLIQFGGGSFEYLTRGESGALSANPWKISVIRSICGDDHLSMKEEENVSICVIKPKPEGL